MKKNNDVFLTTEGVYQLREDFITGNAWEKIDELRAAINAHSGHQWAEEVEKWNHGVTELEKAVGWVPIEDADYMPQSSWIPDEIIDRWVKDENGLDRSTFQEGYVTSGWSRYKRPEKFFSRNEEGKWGIRDGQNGDWHEENDETIYYLNSQKQRSSRIDTAAYNQRADDNFKNWVANTPDVRARLEELYNKKFNGEIGAPTKTYSIKIDGWNPDIVVQPWQWQTIHHLYRNGKGISALGTGFGKTYACPVSAISLQEEGS
jgi:N12 class adenine-specific DNA methylase